VITKSRILEAGSVIQKKSNVLPSLGRCLKSRLVQTNVTRCKNLIRDLPCFRSVHSAQ